MRCLARRGLGQRFVGGQSDAEQVGQRPVGWGEVFLSEIRDPGLKLSCGHQAPGFAQMPIDGIGKSKGMAQSRSDQMAGGYSGGPARIDEPVRPVLHQVQGKLEQFMTTSGIQQLDLQYPRRSRCGTPKPVGDPGPQEIGKPTGGEQAEDQHQDAEINEGIYRAIGPERCPTGGGDAEQPSLTIEIAGADIGSIGNAGEVESTVPAPDRPLGHGAENMHGFPALAAVGQEPPVLVAGGDETKTPGQPQIGNLVLSQTGGAELLAEGAFRVFGAGKGQPIDLVPPVVILEHHASPTGERRVAEDLVFDAGSLRQYRLDVGFDKAVEIAGPKVGAGLDHPVEFGRRQPVSRSDTREPRGERLVRQQLRTPGP